MDENKALWKAYRTLGEMVECAENDDFEGVKDRSVRFDEARSIVEKLPEEYQDCYELCLRSVCRAITSNGNPAKNARILYDMMLNPEEEI